MFQARALYKLFGIAVAIVGICSMSACGGSGSETAQSERINGIAVPQAPDPVANTATVAGVDVDTNGIRDDIDRRLATRKLYTI